MKIVAFMALVSVGGGAWAAGRAAFEVASIRPAQSGRESIEFAPGSLTMRNVRLSACVRWAYDVPEYQFSGPAWLDEARFDIVAKAGTAASEAELRSMLQTLLADRFQLAIHRETKELPALILTVARNGHKLKPNPVEGAPSFKTGKMNLTGQGATLAQLTTFLSREMRQPVIDHTGLTGRFDYFLDINAYVNEEMLKNAGPNGPPAEAPAIIAHAIQAQLGLKVEPKKMPIEMLVVDRMEKTPSEN
jgi:uncharacterized protein (TIGR03435 family)